MLSNELWEGIIKPSLNYFFIAIITNLIIIGF